MLSSFFLSFFSLNCDIFVFCYQLIFVVCLSQDDFYLNLVDWSGQNILSVGLGTCVYLWSACTSQVLKVWVFFIFLCFRFLTLCWWHWCCSKCTDTLNVLSPLIGAIFLLVSCYFFLKVTKLCDLAADGDSVTSVSWSERVSQINLHMVHFMPW